MGDNLYNMKRIIKRRVDYCKSKKIGHQEKYKNGLYLSYLHFYKDMKGMNETNSKIAAENDLKAFEGTNKIIIPRLVVNITDRCTLQCKDCGVLVPYLEKRGEAEIDLLIKDLNKIFDIIDECICLEFIGGEPLLYKKLGTLLQYAQNINKVKMIEITTNATILPDEELLNILANEKTLVQISEYKKVGIQKMEELLSVLNKNKVKNKVLKMDVWFAYGDTDKRNKSMGELRYNYYYCNENKMCRTLYNGKLFVCGRAAALYAMGKLKNASSYLEVRDNEKIAGKDLLNEYIGKAFAEACDFCDIAGDKLKKVNVAEQLVNKKKED